MSDLCPVAVAQVSIDIEYQPETAGESHLLLLKQKKYCDVTFIFPNLPDRIEAHQVFLKARSPEFAKIFRMRESGNVPRNEIKINESSPEIFQQFLEFVYVDKLEVDIGGALDLLQLSLKYKVHPLTKKCEELLQSQIPIMESVKVFETARRYGRRELMDRAGRIMVQSFVKLVSNGALASAEEETLIYLLECDDLAVEEVGLFQFILEWGKKQVGPSADKHLLRDKLKNLILKIRYTNMAPDAFTKVVVPTGLLSAEETISLYSYICADEVTRRGLNNQFNTTRRKVENKITVTKIVDFYANVKEVAAWFPTFSKHCFSFQADGTSLVDCFPKKTFIRAIEFRWPDVQNKPDDLLLKFNVSVGECSGIVKEGSVRIRFQKELSNCKPGHLDKVSVEPPLELVSGRVYSVTVENPSSSHSTWSFRNYPYAYFMARLPNIEREAKIDFGDVSLTLKDIHKKTDFYASNGVGSEEFALITRIEIGLM